MCRCLKVYLALVPVLIPTPKLDYTKLGQHAGFLSPIYLIYSQLLYLSYHYLPEFLKQLKQSWPNSVFQTFFLSDLTFATLIHLKIPLR